MWLLGIMVIVTFWLKFGWFWGLLALVTWLIGILMENDLN